MIISNEQLSAFLDAELSATEMEAIREQLDQDENLATRLAELAMVNQLINRQYSSIDARPMPEAVTRLLETDPPKSAQIMAFPLWKRITSRYQAGLAASAAVIFGFGVAQLVPNVKTQPSDSWQSVAQALQTLPSGVAQVLSSDDEFMARLTFVNKKGEYCRQFRLHSANRATENIACRNNKGWQLTATTTLEQHQQTDHYQTASGGSVLDSALDQMMLGDALNSNTEARVIEGGWTINNNQETSK